MKYLIVDVFVDVINVTFVLQKQEEAYLQSVGRTRPEYWDDFLRKPLLEPLKQHYAGDFLVGLDVSRSMDEEDQFMIVFLVIYSFIGVDNN